MSARPPIPAMRVAIRQSYSLRSVDDQRIGRTWAESGMSGFGANVRKTALRLRSSVTAPIESVFPYPTKSFV